MAGSMRFNLKNCRDCAFAKRCPEYMETDCCLFGPWLSELVHCGCEITDPEAVKPAIITIIRRYDDGKL
jgi:hypothetical protein